MVLSQALITVLNSVFADWISHSNIPSDEFCVAMVSGPLSSLNSITEPQLKLFKKFAEASGFSPDQVLDDYLYCKSDAKYGLGFFLNQRALSHKLASEPTYDGLTFTHDDSWAKCSIYKKGLSHPIEVTEFKQDHDLSKAEHPIRSLRTIALQQAAELFGIRTAYFCERRFPRTADTSAQQTTHAVPVFAQESQPQASIVVPHSELSVVPDNDPITLDAADDEQSVIEQTHPVEIPDEVAKLVDFLILRANQLKAPDSTRHFLSGELKNLNLDAAQIEQSLKMFDRGLLTPVVEINSSDELPEPPLSPVQAGSGIFMDSAVLTMDSLL